MSYRHDKFSDGERVEQEDNLLLEDARTLLDTEGELLIADGYVLRRLQMIFVDPKTGHTITTELEAVR